MSAYQFKAGDPVVCVDADDTQKYSPWGGSGDMDGLQELAVYTIRRVGLFLGEPCIWLEEIFRPRRNGDPEEPGYAVARFRPVQKRSTSLEVFRALLSPTPEQIADLTEHEAYEDARALAEGLYP